MQRASSQTTTGNRYSSRLPNTITIDLSDNDHEVEVKALQEWSAKSNQSLQTSNQGDKPLTASSESNNSIPESVLQYERQLRKVQASQRSVAELSIEKHLNVTYEDFHMIVTNKPSGVLCVPGLNDKPNLLYLVCQHLGLPKENTPMDKMIVHRLDMDTSGLVIYSKSDEALRGLQAAFRDRKVDKEYHALLCGHLPRDWMAGHIHLPLQRDHRHPPFMRVATPRSEDEASQAVKDLQSHGFRKLIKKRPKPSHTEFRVLQREQLELGEASIPVTRVSLTPHTGRTHQLRVHCAALGYPIVGDPAYGLYGEAQARGGLDDGVYQGQPEESELAHTIGASLELQTQLNQLRPPHLHIMCLHAARLQLQHPTSGVGMSWAAPTPF